MGRIIECEDSRGWYLCLDEPWGQALQMPPHLLCRGARANDSSGGLVQHTSKYWRGQQGAMLID